MVPLTLLEHTEGDMVLLDFIKGDIPAAGSGCQSTISPDFCYWLFSLIIPLELTMPTIKGIYVCLVLFRKSMFFVPNVLEAAGNNIPEVYVLDFLSR